MYKDDKAKDKGGKKKDKKEDGKDAEPKTPRTLESAIMAKDPKGAVIQPFETPEPSAAGKPQMNKEELADMVEEFDKKAEFFKDHPYEVSHYTQKMIRKHNKENYWTDQAEPTTPSFNDDDGNAGSHPMGFSVAQIDAEEMNHSKHHRHHHGHRQHHRDHGALSQNLY